MRLAEVLPAGVEVTIVADRGFGDQKRYELLSEQLGFDYIIRFRGNIYVTNAKGQNVARPTDLPRCLLRHLK